MSVDSPPLEDEEDPLTRIAAAPRFGSGLGLHRVAALAPAAISGAPPFSVKIVGSHGKGGTTALADAMLTRCGVRTGRFLSPHVLRPNERIALGGVDLDDAPLRAAAGFALALRDEYEAAHPGDVLSAFEIWFLAALTAFAAARVDVMLLEAGLGGRYDPVRWAPGGVAALTGVDREHVDLLGPSLEHILFDKADVVDAGGRLVVGRLDPDLRRRLDAYLKLRRVTPIHLTDRATVSARTAAFDGAPALACAFDSPHPRLAENAALARLLTEETLRALRRPPPGTTGPIRVMRGPQDFHFDAAALTRFFAQGYRVDRAVDRMGARLIPDAPIHAQAGYGHDIISDGVVPGAIQIPASGAPILLGVDAQTVGGYPKIATVIRADLHRVGQLSPGAALRFADVSRDEAQAAWAALEAAIMTAESDMVALRDPGALYTENLIDGVVDAWHDAP